MSKKGIKDNPISNDASQKHLNNVHLSVHPDTKKAVMNCIPEFLEHHPELRGMKITENFIVKQIADFYRANP